MMLLRLEQAGKELCLPCPEGIFLFFSGHDATCNGAVTDVFWDGGVCIGNKACAGLGRILLGPLWLVF